MSALTGEALVGGADMFWNDDGSVFGLSGQAGAGIKATGFAPAELHLATTATTSHVLFNIHHVIEFFRGVFANGSAKVSCGC